MEQPFFFRASCHCPNCGVLRGKASKQLQQELLAVTSDDSTIINMTEVATAPVGKQIRAALSKAGLNRVDNDVLSKCKSFPFFCSILEISNGFSSPFLLSIVYSRRGSRHNTPTESATDGRMLGSLQFEQEGFRVEPPHLPGLSDAAYSRFGDFSHDCYSDEKGATDGYSPRTQA